MDSERDRESEGKREMGRPTEGLGDRVRDRERQRGCEIRRWKQRTTEGETGRQTGGETRETESDREISGERQGGG